MDSLLNKHAGPPEGKSYYLLYLGELTLHRVYSRCMSPWLLSNMNYQNHSTPCAFTIDHSEFTVVHEEKPLITLDNLPCNGHLKNNNSKPQTGAYNSPMSPTVKSPNGFTVLNMHNLPLSCPLNHVSDVIQVSELNECCVGFIVDRGFEHPLACHVLKCEDYNQSKEVGEKMSKLLTWNQTFSGCTQSSRNVKLEDLDSIRFEVLLLGKIQVKQEFPSPNFIDEAVDKYHSLEKEHAASVAESKLIQNLSVDLRKRNSIDEGGDADVTLMDGSREGAVEILRRNNSEVWEDNQRVRNEDDRQRCNSIDTASVVAMRRRARGRERHCSEPGTAATLGFDKNKTRLLQIGKNSVCLICPDQSARTVEIQFTDITRCAKGGKFKEHFGMFVKDPVHNHHQHAAKEEFRFKCYLFKCSESSVSDEIMQAMKQACTMCSHGPDPLKTFHMLCKRVNLASGGGREQIVERGMNLAAKCIADFPDHDQKSIQNKIAESHLTRKPETKFEQLVVLMAILRQIYEEKQHDHDVKVKQLREQTSANSVAQKLSFFRNRAKKSFSSFESLFEKGMQKMHELHHEAEHHIASPVEKLKFFSDTNRSAPNTPGAPTNQNRYRHRSGSPSTHSDISPLAGSSVSRNNQSPGRPRSSTIGTPDQSSLNVRRKLKLQEDADATLTPGAAMRSDKAGSMTTLRSISSESTPVQSRSSSPASLEEPRSTATADRASGSAKKMTFHQEIFHRITTPSKKKNSNNGVIERCTKLLTPLKTPDDVRNAWRRAIRDNILLNRIRKIQDNQLSSEEIESQLNYVDVGIPQPEMDQVWLELLETDQRAKYKMDTSVLHVAVRKGVSRHLRGRVWSVLHEQWKLRNENLRRASLGSVMLERSQFTDLLKQLTPHQHAILIDLGRTFPTHPYFSQHLGKGQLELFNLLKAYSLVDDEVGYCQGLSFVAGTILIHLNSAEKSFRMLCHLMKDVGCRDLYLPDMSAVRVAVYQLSRLLHDYHRELYDHFEKHEVTLMLFAAPWFLTMFTSILPFCFTARVFDLLFLEGPCALFKTALSLLSFHKAAILEQESFEGTIDFLKNKLPKMEATGINEVLNEIFTLNIIEKLRVYEVEYQVLDEGELFGDDQPPDGENDFEQKLSRLEKMNKTVTKYNLELTEQLEAANMQISSLQQGLSDMAALDEKKAIELESLRSENESLRQKSIR